MRYTDWLRWGVIGGLFLIPLVPFIIADGGAMYNSASTTHNIYIPLANMFFPYITGKNFAFRIIVEITALFYILLACAVPKYRPRASLIMWTMVGFVAWMAIANGFSLDPVKSFWGNFERMEGYIGLFHDFIFFVIAGAMLSAENLWDRFFNLSIAASAVEGVIALFQVFQWFGFAPSSQSGARADTTFGNATYLAVYMLIIFFITLFMLYRRRQSVGWQVAYGLALVLQFIGVYYTQTRGALLGVIGGLIIAALFIAIWGRGHKELKTLRKWSIGGLVAILVVAVGFIALRNTPLIQSSPTLARLASISLQDPTTQARLQDIWPMALKGFVKSPKTVIAGWGQENFDFVFNEFYKPSMFNQEQWFDRAHNQFLDWMIAGGLPAFLLYTALYALAAWAVWRTEFSVTEKAILLGLLGAYAFNNLFVFDNLTSAMYFMALLAFLHSRTKRELPGRLSWSRPLSAQAMAVVAPVALVVILGGAWILNAPAIARATTLVDAVNPDEIQVTSGVAETVTKPPQDALAEFEAAWNPSIWPGNPIGKQEVMEQLLQYASSNASSITQGDPEVAQNVFNTSMTFGQGILAERPTDARINLFIGSFLASWGQSQQAQQYLTSAINESPTKQQILFEEGENYLQEGDTADALTVFKTAYNEAPADTDSAIFYAMGEYSVGDYVAGDQILVTSFGTTTVDNDELLNVYMQTKQYDRAADIWNLRIKNAPTDVQDYLGLAGVYFEEGDKTDTVAVLTKLITVDPGDAAQIQQLITQVQNGTLQQ